MTFRIDRNLVSIEEAEVLNDRLQAVASRREELRRLGKCINGPLEGFVGKRGAVHGPANPKSGKCSRCELIAKETR